MREGGHDARPVRPEPDRPAARRQRPHGAVQLAARARQGRHAGASHRGHRHRALDARVGGRRSSRTCAGSGCTGTRAPTSAARTARIGSRSGCTSMPRTRTSCSPAATPTTASARRRSSRPIGRRTSPRAARRSIAGTCRNLPPTRSQRAHRRRRAAGHPLPGARARRGRRSRISVRGEVAFSSDVIGDPVLVRSDGRPAYNFAVVVDDALMEITHVIRGEDHISNTPRQVLLYQALGFTPPAFAHLALVMGPDHTPLSKRHGATSVAEFRARGYPAGGADELPRAARLVAGRRPGAAADRRAGAPLRDRGRRPQRRRLRSGEAGVDEPSLHEGGGAGAARAPSRRATSSPAATCAADRTRRWSSWRRCCRWRSGRSIGSRRSRIASGSCSSSTPAAALRAAGRRRGAARDAGAREVDRGARRGAARRAGGSIARRSAPPRTASSSAPARRGARCSTRSASR